MTDPSCVTELEERVRALEERSTSGSWRRWGVRLSVLFLLAGLIGAVALAVRFDVTAQVGPGAPAPGVMNYQGQLTDAGGTPLNGNYAVTFSLYNVSGGGTALWTEAHTGGNAVAVTGGLFSTLLGSITPIPSDVMTSSPLYLGITVGTDPEMTPRQPVSSVAYALVANSVPDGAITRAKLATVTRVKELVKSGAWNISDDYSAPPGVNSQFYYSFQVPDDYVSGGLVVKSSYRATVSGGTVELRFQSTRMRDGVDYPGLPIDNTTTSVSGTTVSHVTTWSIIADSNFQPGDTIVVVIARVGADAGDTNTGYLVNDDVWVEYQGKS